MSTEPLRVWAPNASRVEVELSTGRESMHPDGDGWHTFRPLEHGEDYAFVLDGEGPFPDPRSPWQPDGVHSASRHFDTTRFAFTDAGWRGRDARGAVIYELHLGTFTAEGTLASATERLPDLVALGVQLVQLMPVAAFEGERGWGYDGVDLYAVHRAYGGPEALQAFVDTAHGLGLAVSLDVVYNHLGPAGNYLAQFGPYFTDAHHTPWGQAVNLDGPGSTGVRAFIIDNAVRWLRDFHLDALRLDAVHALIDDSPTHLLTELADAVADLSVELGRPLSLIAESDLNDVVMVTPTTAGGLGMTAQWADDVHHAIHAFLTGERHGYYADFGAVTTLAKALTEVFVHDGGYSTFRGQDWGAPVPADTDGHRFVVSTTTHDQVGNRGLGDRPAASLDDAQLAVSAALLLCGPYTPMLFMGEEWAASTPWQYFTDHADPELAAAVRAGREREFAEHGWQQIYGQGDLTVPDPQSPATMAASVLDWGETGTGRHAAIRDFYTRLIALRAQEADLATGDRTATGVEHDPEGTWLVLTRGRVQVAISHAPGGAPVEIPLPGAAAMTTLLSWEPPVAVTGAGITLPPVGVVILRQDSSESTRVRVAEA
ncbi:malto-oligosyltrehalose trehalohydrolase [Ruania zhangjianzhongii]|uniref:malto-oligosyltrehalose trehalohydrolase n=1 Tax=Ruania zhangjianzhongii TaxID=2603206 RepID=UPI0011C7A2A1|nr:malto-oligosyltrehalose trehalohydrolase [Ruania zhangjianzhongii]